MIITLTSDFGLRDAAIAAAKAALIRHVPDATIVDVCHTVARQDLQHAAYLLQSAWKHFPAGTVHIVAAGLFSNDPVKMVIAPRTRGYVLAPDNGILPLAFVGEKLDTRLCFTLNGQTNVRQWAAQLGSVISALHIRQDDLPYPEHKLQQAPRVLQPRQAADGIECNILFIDRYENIVLDITREQFEHMAGSRSFKIKMTRLPDVTALSYNYNDVEEGQPLCRFNEAGYLEIALNRDKAASWLGLNNYAVNVRYHTIKIFL